MKFKAEELDLILSGLNDDCGLREISEVENMQYQDSIYRQLEAMGMAYLHEGDNHVIVAGLTKRGLAFRSDGGFVSKEKKRRKIRQINYRN